MTVTVTVTVTLTGIRTGLDLAPEIWYLDSKTGIRAVTSPEPGARSPEPKIADMNAPTTHATRIRYLTL